MARIAHLGDVHIRPALRHKEYKQQFDKLYESLRTEKPTKIVVAGDVFDAKLSLSPEAVQICYDFFSSLSEIAHVYVIAGNHDCSLSNKTRMDSIEAIAYMLRSNERFHYLQHSGIYETTDVTFGVFSILDEESEWPVQLPYKSPSSTYIALYHAPLQGVSLGHGQTHEDGKAISMFANYDLTMLADIHIRQFLDPRTVNATVPTKELPMWKHQLDYKVMEAKGAHTTISYTQGTIAYPGSLIQQNFGEEPVKGYLLWDTDTKSSKFVPIPNDYKFVTIRVDNQAELEPFFLKKASAQTRIKIVIKESLTRAQETDIKNRCIVAFKLEEPPVVNSGVNNFETYRETNKDLWVNYSNPTYQLELLETWLKNNNYDGNAYIEECKRIHQECFEKAEIPDYSNAKWRLTKSEFSNIGTFGEGNSINYGKLKGLVGLFAGNRQGKSTILETMVYGTTGKRVKDVGLDNFVNLRRTKSNVITQLEMGDKHYKIERSIGRKKAGGTSSTVNAMVLEGSEWKSINEKDAVATNKKLGEMFGTREDILLTSVSSQENSAGLIDLSDADRLETLYRFTNLTWFEKLRAEAKKSIAQLEAEIGVLRKSSNSESYALLQSKERICADNIAEFEEQLREKRLQVEVIGEEMNELQRDLRALGESSELSETQAKLEDAQRELNYANETIHSFTVKKKSVEIQIEKAKDKVKAVLKGTKYADIVSLSESVRTMEQDRATAQGQVRVLTERKRTIDNKLTILNAQPWVQEDENCKKCMFLKDAWDAKDDAERLIEELAEFHNKVTILNEHLVNAGFTFHEIQTVKDTVNEFKTLKSNLEKYALQIETSTANKEKAEQSIQQYVAVIANYTTLLTDLSHNNLVQHNISLKEFSKKRLINDAEYLEKTIWAGKNELIQIQAKIQHMDERLQQVLELEGKTRYYQAYIKAVSKDGMPLEIIKGILPQINAEVNSILSQTQDWKIVIHADNGKLNIEILDIAEDECLRPIETASGAERVITSIALRVAFTKISFLPRSTYFCVDEGFGSLDSDNLPKMRSFLMDIQNYFDFVLIVSHVPAMMDICNEQLTIKQENRISAVEYT